MFACSGFYMYALTKYTGDYKINPTKGVADIKSEVKILLIFLTGIMLGVLFFARMFVCQRSDMVHDGDIMHYDVDSNGDLYVGYMRAIDVYREGEWVRTISPHTSRGYSFCIKNDEIYVEGHVVMSLEGEVLRECKYGEVSNPAGNLFNRKLEKDGRTYTLLRHAGFEPGEILRDGEQIYKESKADCFWNGAYYMLIWGALFLVFGFLLLDFFATEGMVGKWWK